MTRPSRSAVPAWKPPYTCARLATMREGRPQPIPACLMAYDEAEDRAYHRINGMVFRPRVKPEVPEQGTHPRCAFRTMRVKPQAVKTTRDQLRLV